MGLRPLISIVLATHNRREVVLATLAKVQTLRDEVPLEVVVVDNASRDGTPQAVRDAFPHVQLVALSSNRGSCAKALGVAKTSGAYIVFLDDDSHPHPGALSAMVRHFVAEPRLGAASFRVHLPDGRQECSAFPDVFIGCGVGFRRTAYEAAGGLDLGFFMQAEEYDLSFRLVQTGWAVRTFDDLHVEHLKTPAARASARTVYYDTRNNLALADRYLPRPYLGIYRPDWAQRYRWIARQCGHESAYWRARAAASLRMGPQRRAFASRRLSSEVFEQFFRWNQIAAGMQSLAADSVRRVLLADLGKNIYPFVAQAFAAGIRPVAIADDRFAAPGRHYRGISILPVWEALREDFDAVIVSNTSPIHASATAAYLAKQTSAPVHAWFGSATAADRQVLTANVGSNRLP